MNDHRVPLNLLLALMHGLLPRELLACNLPLLEDTPFENVVCGEMDPTGRSKDTAVNLCLTQQLNPFLRVGNGDNVRALYGFVRDLHNVAIVTF